MTNPQPDTGEFDAQPRPRLRSSQVVPWLIAGLLAVIALQLAFRQQGAGLTGEALAQFQQQAGARGVYAFTGQLDKNTYGLFMLDVDAGTIWCYEFTGRPPADRRMKLAAARLWLYDRYLENFNVDGLTPDEVAELVEDQRRQKLDSDRAASPE
jgi:hypothetical protein